MSKALPKKKRMVIKGEPAYVSYKSGRTINLGNYESQKYEIMVTMPCGPADINKTYDKAKEFVDAKLGELVPEEKKITEEDTDEYFFPAKST